MKRVLLLASTRAYQTDDFAAMARKLGIALVLGTDRCHVLADAWTPATERDHALVLDFRDPGQAARTIADAARETPLAGIVASDETTAIIAAEAAALLGLPGNTASAARIASNKLYLREALTGASLAQPRFATWPRHRPPTGAALAARGITFPVVIKPLHLSTSRGVMRADDPAELATRWARLASLLGQPVIAGKDPARASEILVESFVPGREVAFEGLLVAGELHELAVFDKPDPLDGPFFAETLYVTPSTEPPAVQEAIRTAVSQATRAMGLAHGPVHAELRLPGTDPIVLELAARAIGGLCGRVFGLTADMPLAELILRQAAGGDGAALAQQVRDDIQSGGASGVLMIPVPGRGVLRAVAGLDEARALPSVRDVVITARPGDSVEPLPEGNTYMGFAFAAAAGPAAVASALRAVHAALSFDIASTLA